MRLVRTLKGVDIENLDLRRVDGKSQIISEVYGKGKMVDGEKGKVWKAADARVDE